MLGLALLFLVVAVLAHFLGAGQAGAAAVELAKWCFIIFIILLVVSLLLSVASPGPYWGWPLYRP